MDDRTAVPAWLLDILVRQSGLEPREVTADARLDADLGLDSLDQIEIVMHVEEQRCIDIDADQIAADATVADLVKLIDRTIALKAGVRVDG